jgi:hypothetical protein
MLDTTKLQIIVYKDDRLQEEVSRLSVPVNPARFSRKLQIKYNEEQEQGTHGANPSFNKTPAEEIQLEFLFDGTGVIDGKRDVRKQITEFKEAVYSFDGEIHRPKFLKLLWGELAFNCILKDLKIDYTLFKPDGSALRAILNATFMEVVEEELRAKKMRTSSPDLTHIRYVKEGDTLPLMAFQIYGNAALYMQVARFNGITNFRNLRPNMRIVFPPIDKTL